MYKKVESQIDQNVFHQIKEVSWDGKGFEMEYIRDGSDAYLIYDEDGLPGGTFEFTSYSETLTRDFMKGLFNDSIKKDMKAVEIDSFSVLPAYRGKLGREIICLLIHYAQEHGYTHAIGIADPSVFRSFKETYHIPSHQVADAMWYKGDYVIPTLFDLKAVYDHLKDEKYAWFNRPVALEEGKVAVS